MKQTLNLKDETNKNDNRIKFLYSYGGKILPRRSDGKLRYVGGYTRVLAVDRSITFAELMVKFGELCGSSMSLKCKLPSEDLDLLVSITCDDDLANTIEEYDRFSSSTNQELKIRAILFPIKSLKKISPPSSPVFHLNFSESKSPPYTVAGFSSPPDKQAATKAYRYDGRNSPAAVGFPIGVREHAGKFWCHPCHVHGRTVPHRNYWQ